MDFELTKEQKQIQKSVREFVKGEFKKSLFWNWKRNTNTQNLYGKKRLN